MPRRDVNSKLDKLAETYRKNSKAATSLDKPQIKMRNHKPLKDFKAISIQNYHLVNGTSPMRFLNKQLEIELVKENSNEP